MKDYKIFEHPQGKTEAVKQGWSWPAFLFGILWAFFKKIYIIGVPLIIIIFIISLISAGIGGETEQAIEGFMNFAGFVLAIVFGVNGNKWREKNLLSRGFEYKDTVSAANTESAIAAFIKQFNRHENITPENVPESLILVS